MIVHENTPFDLFGSPDMLREVCGSKQIIGLHLNFLRVYALIAIGALHIEHLMTVCKFYLQGQLFYYNGGNVIDMIGNCKFGNGCRFEHRAPRPNEAEYSEWRRLNPGSLRGETTMLSADGQDSHATRKGWSYDA